MDDLPGSFDLIVVGTGMAECIIAAAAARAGKSVLHLDRNGYYGGDWASFNYEQLLSWIEEQQATVCTSGPDVRMLEASWLEQLNDNEHLVLCPKKHSTVSDVVQRTYVKEKRPSVGTSSKPVSSQEDEHIISPEHIEVKTVNEQQDEDTPQSASMSAVPYDIQEDDGNEYIRDVASDSASVAAASIAGCEQKSDGTEARTEQETSSAPSDVGNFVGAGSNPSEQLVSEDGAGSSEQTTGSEETTVTSNAGDCAGAEKDQSCPVMHEWTMEDIYEHRRKFNIDLSPKLLFSRGSLVELLISSNIARYAEFQSVNRILTYINGHLEQVPCSRADVFSTKNVSVVEKRMLMKLLTFCMEFQKHPEEYRGYEGRSFIEFLKSRKLTENIEHYVLHAISMVDEMCPTLQGLVATQRFMDSLGRYGNSPFLWTCYGSGELPQCFCRLCAVFGGIYYLKRDADAVVLNSENHCAGVISHGRKLKCQSLVMEYSYAPLEYVRTEPNDMVSRAIYITDASLMPAERQQNTLLRLPPVPGIHNAITVLEFGSLSFICPDGFYLVHMISQSTGKSIEDEFRLAEENLFDIPSVGDNRIVDCVPSSGKPKVLWCLYFKQRDMTMFDLNSSVPDSVFLTSSSDAKLDYEHAVKEAREIFAKMYPGEEFLPRAPDPEDIVMDEHSNPGDVTEGHSSENENIENDYVAGEDANSSTVSDDDTNRETCSTLAERAQGAVASDVAS